MSRDRPTFRVLAVFACPPGESKLRLDEEDRVLTELSRKFESVELERQHASRLEDIHAELSRNGLDVVHFSTHGSREGVVLEDLTGGTETVSPEQIVSLLQLSDQPPHLAVFLCCFSHQSVDELAEAAPYVITVDAGIPDDDCILFSRGLYEQLFSGSSIDAAFDHATHVLKSRQRNAEPFRLSRRSLTRQRGSDFVEIKSTRLANSILVNLDQVVDNLDALGLEREEVFHSIARKIRIHRWIFASIRDQALVPIGRMLFGEFSWAPPGEEVFCTRLVRLSADAPEIQWRTWSALLTSYNDLASLKYRNVDDPTDPIHRDLIEDSLQIFEHHIPMYLVPARGVLEKLGILDALPSVAFSETACQSAREQVLLGRPQRAIVDLEHCLTSYHDVVDALQPSEEASTGESRR